MSAMPTSSEAMTPIRSIATDVKIDMASKIRRADPTADDNEKGHYDCYAGNEAASQLETPAPQASENKYCNPSHMKSAIAKKGQFVKLPFGLWSPSSAASPTSMIRTPSTPPPPVAEDTCCKEPPLTKEAIMWGGVDDITRTDVDETGKHQCFSSSNRSGGDQNEGDDIMSESSMIPGAALQDDAFVNPFLYAPSQNAHYDRDVGTVPALSLARSIRFAGASTGGCSRSHAASGAFKKHVPDHTKMTHTHSERGVAFAPTAAHTSKFNLQKKHLKITASSKRRHVPRATSLPPSALSVSPAKVAFERRRSLRRAQSERGANLLADNGSGGLYAPTRSSPPLKQRKEPLAIGHRHYFDLRRTKSEIGGVIGNTAEAANGDGGFVTLPGGQHQLYAAPPLQRAVSDTTSACLSPTDSPLFHPTHSLMSDMLYTAASPPLMRGANIDICASPRQVHRHFREVEEKIQAARSRTYQLDHHSRDPDIKDITSRIDRAASWPTPQEEHSRVHQNTALPWMPDLCQGRSSTIEARPQSPLHSHDVAPTPNTQHSLHKQHRSCSLSRIPEQPSNAGSACKYSAAVAGYGTNQPSWSPNSTGGSTSRANQSERHAYTHRRNRKYSYSKAPSLESILTSGEEDEGEHDLNHDERTPLLLAPKNRRDWSLDCALSQHPPPWGYLHPSGVDPPTSSFCRRPSEEHHRMHHSQQELDAFMHHFQLLQEKEKAKCSRSHARCDCICAVLFVVQLIAVFVLGIVELFCKLLSYDGVITSTNDSDRKLFFGTSICITLGCGVFASLLSGGILLLVLVVNDDRNLIPVSLMLTIFFSFAWGVLGARVSPQSDDSRYSPAPALGFVVCMICTGYAVVIWHRIPWSSANLHAALAGIRFAFPGLWIVALVAQAAVLLYSLWWVLTVVSLYGYLNGAQTAWASTALLVTLIFMVICYIWTFQVIVHAVHVIVARVLGRWWEHGGYGEEEDDAFSLTAHPISSARRNGLNQQGQDVEREIVGRKYCEEKHTETHNRNSELWQAVWRMVNLRLFAALCHGSLFVCWVHLFRQLLDQCHDSKAVKHLEDNAFVKSPQREQDLIDEEELRCSKRGSAVRYDKGADKLLKRTNFFCGPWCGCVWPTESNTYQLTLPFWARVHQDWNHSYNQWGFMFLGLYDHLKWKDAATNADEQLHIRGWSTIANDDLIRNVLRLVSLVIGGCTGCFGLLLVEYFVSRDPRGIYGGSASTADITNTPHNAFVIGLVVGTALGSVIMNVVVASVNTVILCYAGHRDWVQAHHPLLSYAIKDSLNKYGCQT